MRTKKKKREPINWLPWTPGRHYSVGEFVMFRNGGQQTRLRVTQVSNRGRILRYDDVTPAGLPLFRRDLLHDGVDPEEVEDEDF
jgi:hypothetical protein